MIRKNVANATSSENRCRPLFITSSEMSIADSAIDQCKIGNRQSEIRSVPDWNLQRRHDFQRAWTSCSRSSLAERKVSLGAAGGRHCHLHGFFCTCSSALAPGNDGVGSSRYALNRIGSVLTTHAEERVFQNANVSLHPGVLITFDRNQYLGLLEGLFNWRGAIRLCLVPLRIVFWSRVNVVLCRIAVGDFERLIGLNPQDMRPVMTAVLVQRHCLRRRVKTIVPYLGAVREGTVLDVDKYVRHFSVLDYRIVGCQVWTLLTANWIRGCIDFFRGWR